tara:strand:- start:897 stop:1112 length:216 start_codon:yes stop_codon:yes gene_type:complete
MNKTNNKKKCPKCGSNKVIPIVYGDIDGSPETMKKIENNEISPGGCLIEKNSPKWECGECKNQFGKIDINF